MTEGNVRVWRVGHVDGPLDFPPEIHLADPRLGRFDDPWKEYRTLYCSRYQCGALRETLQHFRRDAPTLVELKKIFGSAYPRSAKVPGDWRAKHVLVPARIRLAAGASLVAYEDPSLLRELEHGFAEVLESQGVSSLDIPSLRSRDRIVSQFFGRLLFNQGYAGISFRSRIPPSSPCFALFEGRAWLEPAGAQRPLTKALPALRSVCMEFRLDLS